MAIKKLQTALPAALNQIRQGATFLAIHEYTNNYGEISNFGLVFHIDYIKAVKEAISIWLKYKPKTTIEHTIRNELIDSYSDTLKGLSRSTSAHAYIKISDGVKIIKGVKYHEKNEAIHLYGFLVHKKVLHPVEYKKNKMPETIIKDQLRAMTRLPRFRQFKLVDERFKKISVEKLTLTQKDLYKKLEK